MAGKTTKKDEATEYDAPLSDPDGAAQAKSPLTPSDDDTADDTETGSED